MFGWIDGDRKAPHTFGAMKSKQHLVLANIVQAGRLVLVVQFDFLKRIVQARLGLLLKF